MAAREAPARAAIAYSEATSCTTPVCRAAKLRVCRGARERGAVPWVEAGGRCRGRLVTWHGAGYEMLAGNS